MTDAAIAAAYDARAAEYIQVAGDIAQADAADRTLIAQWRDTTSGTLIDAGCGPGQWTQFLHSGARDVTGIDISEQFLIAARERHPHLSFEHASLRNLPFENASFGGILAWYSLIHTPPDELPLVLAELARVLAPGGSILLGYFEGTPRDEFAHAIAPAYFWSSDALAELFADAGLTVTAAEHRDREPGEVSRRPHGAVTATNRAD